jgi:hypothetical protein
MESRLQQNVHTGDTLFAGGSLFRFRRSRIAKSTLVPYQTRIGGVHQATRGKSQWETLSIRPRALQKRLRGTEQNL